MEYRVDGHEECIGCGKDGFLIRGFEGAGDGGLKARIVMDGRTEGWVGIPHGGIGMGAIMELISGLPDYPEDPYPIRAEFRMGGAGVVVGDEVSVRVSGKEKEEKGASGIIEKTGESQPYISGDISYNKGDPGEKVDFAKSRITCPCGELYLPENFSDLEGKLIPLPSYKDCFVCGTKRTDTGLLREFHLWEDSIDSGRNIVISLVGFDPDDLETFFRFKKGDFVHPLALLALGDETTGWSGFFISKNGGVSVRLNYTFYRDVKVGERLVFFGKGERRKGDISKRLFFWATGGAAVVGDDGSLETVMTTSGQWLGIKALTDQMRVHLTPDALRKRAFEIAGVQ